MKGCLYKIGDKVKVVKFGHIILVTKDDKELSFPVVFEDETTKYLDMCPELVGQEGVICEATLTQGIPHYAIDGIKGKHAWYSEKQLELTK